MRRAAVKRKTGETRVELELELDERGDSRISTGIPFFDHMLRLMLFHAGMRMRLEAEGDLDVDQHHTVEDVGLCLGEALREALGDRGGVRRYGWTMVPMDESLARVALDLSGRPHLSWRVDLPVELLSGFDPLLAREFFQALVNRSGITLHAKLLECGNPHHGMEAVFKAVGLALGEAVALNPWSDAIPSSKGKLD